MKPNSTCNKLSLIALLSLGLVCSPLVANAGDNDRGRHGNYQQDRGKTHYKADHRDYGYDDRHSYRNDYKHGHKNRRHHHNRRGHHGHRHDSHRRYTHGNHYEHNYRRHHARYDNDVDLILGLYSGNMGIIFRD